MGRNWTRCSLSLIANPAAGPCVVCKAPSASPGPAPYSGAAHCPRPAGGRGRCNKINHLFLTRCIYTEHIVAKRHREDWVGELLRESEQSSGYCVQVQQLQLFSSKFRNPLGRARRHKTIMWSHGKKNTKSLLGLTYKTT